MKVKEVIKFECWVDDMRIWQNTYAENVIEISEADLPKTADGYDWSWYDLPENPDYLILLAGGRDIKIIVEFFAGDAMPEHDEPISKFYKWESEIFKEREEVWSMSTKRDKAINYLSWYFKTLFAEAGFCWDESNDGDIEYLIDMIIDAAAEKNDLCYETYKARTAKRCNECLECHHFGNGCDGDSEPCEAFEYPY